MSYHEKPATFVGKVQIRTENLERSLRFYQNILGFSALEQDRTSAKLSADGEKNILSIVQPPDVIPKQLRKAGLYHFAILLPQRSDLALLVNRLVQQGVQIGASDHHVSEAIYFEDPDGNGIEVYADRDPSSWDWHGDSVSMTTDPLDFADLQASIEPGETWTVLPPQTIIGHLHLHVSDLEESEHFYTQGLGFEIVTRFRDSAIFLSTHGYHHHIALNTWAGVGAPQAPSNSVGLDYFTLVYPDEQTRQEAVANLRALGATVEETEGTFIVADPAGNIIQL